MSSSSEDTELPGSRPGAHDLDAEAQRALRELLGRFAGGVVHDFSNLVQIVELEARSLMEVSDEPALVREHAVAILEVNRRAHIFIQRLLSLRTDTDAATSDVSVTALVERMRRPLELALGSRYRLMAEPGVEELSAEVDATQLEQIIVCLLLNARAASEPGSTIAVRVEAVDAGPEVAQTLVPGRYVRLSVRDQGCGMTAAVRERAFDPFFTTGGQRSLGLGLTTAREMARRHGGEVTLSSEPGRGTTAHVYLRRSQ